MPAPIIVSALFDAQSFAWLDGLRRAHFPPERNHIAAHLTLFHHLPPSIVHDLDGKLRDLTRGARPVARAVALMNLGRGVAIRIDSPDLAAIRNDLAMIYADCLIPQDRAGWRPHVTIQNKVAPDQARALQAALDADFQTRPVGIAGLAAWWYRGGPWEPICRHMFR